jgi:hypothetical protein
VEEIKDLLSSRSPEPPQLKALRDYVKNNHDTVAKASVSQLGYSISVSSAPLASDLRMEIPKIVKECNLDKKLFIRIG